MSTIIQSILVVAALPRSVPAMIIRVNGITSSMTTNKPTFPSPTPPLALVSAHVVTLSEAETASKTRTLGTIDARNNALMVVVADVHQLHGYVQQVANADPSQAEIIAAAAGMTLRKKGVHHKSNLVVKQTVSTVVDVVAKAVKGGCSYEWQLSTDGGKTWVNAPPTAQARTQIKNLEPGVLVVFRQRVVMPTGVGNWSAPVTAAIS